MPRRDKGGNGWEPYIGFTGSGSDSKPTAFTAGFQCSF